MIHMYIKILKVPAPFIPWVSPLTRSLHPHGFDELDQLTENIILAQLDRQDLPGVLSILASFGFGWRRDCRQAHTTDMYMTVYVCMIMICH